MRCVTYLFWLALLGVMANYVLGAEDLPGTNKINDDDSETTQLAVNPYSAYQESIWAQFWNSRFSPRTALPSESISGRYYDDDDDDDDYYYRGGYQPTPIIQPIQIPQAQSYQPNYYGGYQQQQQQPSFTTYLPLPYPSGGGHKKKKKKKSKPVCCCATTACLETCNPASYTPPTLCVCNANCCLKYAASNPGCPAVRQRSEVRSAFFDSALYRKKLDEFVDRYLEKNNDETE